MTNQEAIKIIKDLIAIHKYSKEHIAVHKYGELHAIHIVQALEMAIKALEQPEIVRCKDCNHHLPNEYGLTCYYYFMGWMRDDGFCSLCGKDNE